MTQTEILQPPELELDKILYKSKPMPTHVRLERRIVWNMLEHLKAAGWVPDYVWDGGENTQVADAKAAMEILFNLDDATLHVKRPDAKTQKEYQNGRAWVFLVFGNETDIISDYSVNLGSLLDNKFFDTERFA